MRVIISILVGTGISMGANMLYYRIFGDQIPATPYLILILLMITAIMILIRKRD